MFLFIFTIILYIQIRERQIKHHVKKSIHNNKIKNLNHNDYHNKNDYVYDMKKNSDSDVEDEDEDEDC
jgi:hypothetical protein